VHIVRPQHSQREQGEPSSCFSRELTSVRRAVRLFPGATLGESPGMHLENIPLTLHPPPRPTAQLAMRHERIPIEQKLSNDAQCRPATPAFEGALMGTARSSGNGKTGTTAGFDSNSPGAHGHHGGNDMDWLMGAGNLDDPLSSLMVSHQPPSRLPSPSPPPSRSRIQRRGARDAPAPADHPPHETRKPESVRNAHTSHHHSTFLIPPDSPRFPHPSIDVQTLEQEGNSSGGHFNLGDDLFGMPAANPSGMESHHFGSHHHDGSNLNVKFEPFDASPQSREGNGDSYAGNAQTHRQDNSSGGSSDQSTSTDLINGRGHSVNGRASINQGAPMASQMQSHQQNGGHHMMQGLREETVLTRPFAQSALRQAQLQRYRAKRIARHLGHKKIRYECRKTLADNRPRIKGRFAKVNSEADLSAMVTAQSCPDLSALHRAAKLDEERGKDSSTDSNTKDGLNKKGAAANRKSRLSDGSDDTVADAAKPGTKQTPTRKKTSPVKKEIKKEPGAEEVVFRALRGGGKPLMPYTQSEVSLVALDREGAW